MRRIGFLFLLTLALIAPGGCAARNAGPDDVVVTRDRNKVRNCVDLARVTTELEDEAGVADLRRNTAELGGNCLLVYNSRSGGAFYCEDIPIDPPEGFAMSPTREAAIPRPGDVTPVSRLPQP
jgi:hypothetical protein